jgi:hypothetical protein
MDFGTDMACQDVDARTAGHKRFDHLSGDLLGIGTDAFIDDTVVCSHHQKGFTPDGRLQASLDTAELFRHIVQATQCARGHHQRGGSLSGPPDPIPVDRLDSGRNFIQRPFGFWHFFLLGWFSLCPPFAVEKAKKNPKRFA